MIQRLDARGKLTVKLDLRPKVLKREWDGRTETTWWSDVPTPVWVVTLIRPGGPQEMFFRLMGSLAWRDVWAEDEDLDTALRDALERSEPQWVSTYERVWEHEGYKRAADFADQFEVYADAV